MEKTIKIGNKNVKMRTSAAIPGDYRDLFGRDIFQDMTKIGENIDNISYDMFEVIENFAYLCAKKGGTKVPDTVSEWLDQFEGFDVVNAAEEIIELWVQSNTTKSEPKKAKGQ